MLCHCHSDFFLLIKPKGQQKLTYLVALHREEFLRLNIISRFDIYQVKPVFFTVKSVASMSTSQKYTLQLTLSWEVVDITA